MKNIILNLLILTAVGLFLSGCYTVVWSPEDNFPTQSDYEQGYYDGYYGSPFYGDYGYYYNYPWWLNIAPPAVNATSKNRVNTATGEYEIMMAEEEMPQDEGGNVNTLHALLVNSGGSDSSGSNTSVNKSSSSSSSSSSSGRNSSSSSSSGSENVRNNNGSRNSGAGENNVKNFYSNYCKFLSNNYL